MKVANNGMCAFLWGSDDYDWVFKPYEGRSGGLLLTWGRSIFVCNESVLGSHFVGLVGWWGVEKISVSLVNVYAQCDLS